MVVATGEGEGGRIVGGVVGTGARSEDTELSDESIVAAVYISIVWMGAELIAATDDTNPITSWFTTPPPGKQGPEHIGQAPTSIAGFLQVSHKL